MGAAAILITLVYLAAQIRQAKIATLGQIVQSRASEFNVVAGLLAGNGELADIMIPMSNNDAITDADELRMRAFIMMLWNQVYSAYVHRQREIITEDEFALTQQAIVFILTGYNGYGDSCFDDPSAEPSLFGDEFYRWASKQRRQILDAGENANE